MKNSLKYILQKLLGFRNYLFVFSLFKIKTLKWDKKENDFFYFLAQLEKEFVVLDIGANIGIMTAHLSQKCKEVIAYEPVPDNLATLKKIIKRLSLANVIVREVALGNKQGKVEMLMPNDKGVKMQGLSHVAGVTGHDEPGSVYEVPLVKLDEEDLLKSRKVGAIKMDVENYEFEVLKGAEQLLRRDRPLIYTELWDNENRKECFGFLASLGYNTQVLVNSNLINYDPEKHTSQNFFFIPFT